MSEQNKDEIISQMRAEIDRLNNAITSLEEGKESLTDQVSELELENSELQSDLETQIRIKTGRDNGIHYVADNLLDQQIMEALCELIENHDNVTLLQHLQSLSKVAI